MKQNHTAFFIIAIFFFVFNIFVIINNQHKILENQEEILYILDGIEDEQIIDYSYADFIPSIPLYSNSSKSKTELIKDVNKEIEYLNININKEIKKFSINTDKEIKKTKDKIEKLIKEN